MFKTPEGLILKKGDLLIGSSNSSHEHYCNYWAGATVIIDELNTRTGVAKLVVVHCPPTCEIPRLPGYVLDWSFKIPPYDLWMPCVSVLPLLLALLSRDDYED